MKRETREWLILSVLILIFLLIGVIVFSQDSVRVKIMKIDGNKVWMKTTQKPKVNLFTFCKCPYKEKEIVWIKKP